MYHIRPRLESARLLLAAAARYSFYSIYEGDRQPGGGAVEVEADADPVDPRVQDVTGVIGVDVAGDQVVTRRRVVWLADLAMEDDANVLELIPAV